MENLDTTANNFFEVASNYTWIVVIAALIVVGFIFIIGGQQGKERARSWIPGILVGAIIVIGAVSIGKFIVSLIAF